MIYSKHSLASSSAANRRSPARSGIPGYRYWFVLDRHEAPRVAIDITLGTAWSPDAEHDLMREYTEAGRRLGKIRHGHIDVTFKGCRDAADG